MYDAPRLLETSNNDTIVSSNMNNSFTRTMHYLKHNVDARCCMQIRLYLLDPESFLHYAETSLRVLPYGLHGTIQATLVNGCRLAVPSTCNCMNPIVVAAIVNNKGTTHVQGVKLIIDDPTMIQFGENVVSPNGNNEGVISNHSLVVASAFKSTYPGMSICAAMTMHAQYSGRVRKTIVPYENRVALIPSVIGHESRSTTIPRGTNTVLAADCARNT